MLGSAVSLGRRRVVGGSFAFLLVALSCSWPGTAQAGEWGDVLLRYAQPNGFNYDGLNKDADTKKLLDTYVASLATMKKSAPLHKWLNAYNALVVHAVIKHYPLKSVMDVPGFFKTEKYKVAGEMRTLDDIENKIIRPRFKDPRVHVALNCGARSCPKLHIKPFKKHNLDRTLDRLATEAVASDIHVRVNKGKVDVSEIFHWFSGDFEAAEGTVLAWLKKYDKTKRLKRIGKKTKLGKIPYDWALNQSK